MPELTNRLRSLGRRAVPTVVGADHVMAKGAMVLLSNHQHPWDQLLLRQVLRRRVVLHKAVSGAHDRHLMDAIQRGEVSLIFSEGGVSPDGKLHRTRLDVARLVAVLARQYPQVPLIPVAVSRSWPLSVHFGAALDLSLHLEHSDDDRLHRVLADAISNGIMELSGQEYVDTDVEEHRAQLRRAARADVQRRREQAVQRRADEKAAAEAAKIDFVTEADELAEAQRRAEAAAQAQAKGAAAKDALRARVRAQRTEPGQSEPLDPRDPIRARTDDSSR